MMMSRGYKNFIIFNRKQNDSELAAGDIDSAFMAGIPRLIGDHYMVVFITNFSTRTDESAYDEQMKNAKKYSTSTKSTTEFVNSRTNPNSRPGGNTWSALSLSPLQFKHCI